MAYSYVQYTGNGATTNYAIPFSYLDSSHIKVRVNGVITAFTLLNSSTVQISPAPLAGTIIDIRRETPKDSAPVNFTDGSVLLEKDLDLLAAFNLYTAQESADGVQDAIVKDTTGVWDAQSRRIKDVANPVNANDAVNKNWAETAMSSQLASATAQATIATTKAGEASASASSASASASTATSKASEAGASATSASNSATSASASATTATTKASEALASQVASAASASTASTKASEANTSAGNAANSASTATTQAGIATTKATEASNSASSAATSASTATTKADSATASASAASASATLASTKASEASADATNAANSASNSASSANLANDWATKTSAPVAGGEYSAKYHAQQSANSASASASSASASAASASDSANSATSAAASAASAAAILDNFDDRYLGSKSSAPTVDNDGNALILGALYFDTTTGKMRVYTASGWIDASSASVATLGTFKFTATGGQTSFSGTGDTGIALSYTVGAVIVSLNGVLLEEGSEYTATTGTSIVLASGASTGDELNVYAFGNFLVADTYSRAESDSRFVNTTGDTMTGDLDVLANIGVGTLTPNKGGVGRAVTLNTASGGNIIEMCVAEDRKGWVYADDARTVLSAGGNRLAEIQTNGVARIVVDGSGRVTTPAQPAFLAYPNSVFNEGTENAVIQYNTTAVNIGNHYNTSTKRFTAPIAGLYYFSASFWSMTNNWGYMAIAKNGDISAMGARGRTGGVGDYVFTTLNSIMYLNANDFVDCRCAQQGMTVHINNGYNNFSGYLIG